jgi:hypothetical protein
MQYEIEWSYATFSEEIYKILRIEIFGLACMIISTLGMTGFSGEGWKFLYR